MYANKLLLTAMATSYDQLQSFNASGGRFPGAARHAALVAAPSLARTLDSSYSCGFRQVPPHVPLWAASAGSLTEQ